MNIRIINKSDHPLPHYETNASAGLDLRANISEAITLQPLERAIIKTGLFIELPIGLEAQVRPRSGLAAKKGITVLNAPGTIDADYRGEIGVILVNLSTVHTLLVDAAIRQYFLRQRAFPLEHAREPDRRPSRAYALAKSPLNLHMLHLLRLDS